MTYIVWSHHVPETGEPYDAVETRRTDRKVAEEDRAILQDILHRKSWVQEEGA